MTKEKDATAEPAPGGNVDEKPPPVSQPEKPKKEKKVPEGLVIPPKKPKLTKAERRALQEQQRAAKAGGSGGPKSPPPPQQPPSQPATQPAAATTTSTALPGSTTESATTSATGGGGGTSQKRNDNEMSSLSRSFVSTLSPFRDPHEVFDTGARLQVKTGSGSRQLHPAVLQLGYQYATGEIRGGNARCRHMLHCFERLLHDFVEPPSDQVQDFRHVLDSQVLKASFQFWTEQCRPHSVSMGNAFTVLKAAVASLDRTLSFDEMRTILLDAIAAYRRERIEYADRAIADLVHQKLLSNRHQAAAKSSTCAAAGLEEEAEEVVLTFGYSEVVDQSLRQAAQEKCSFRVIIVDSRPLLEGRRLLTSLRSQGIACTYVLLNALTYVLQDVTKVFLGASALMSDGSVWARAGSACVALAAHAEHIPVLVCSETYKISNRVQLESLTANELSSPYQPLAKTTATMAHSLEQPQPQHEESSTSLLPNLKELNLLYDLTPADFVSGIVTELGIIPPSSVAVLLREMNHPQG